MLRRHAGAGTGAGARKHASSASSPSSTAQRATGPAAQADLRRPAAFLNIGSLRGGGDAAAWVNSCQGRAHHLRTNQLNFWANEYTLVTQGLDVQQLQAGLWQGKVQARNATSGEKVISNGNGSGGDAAPAGNEEGRVQLCKEIASMVVIRCEQASC